jgi:hypothetical protein
LATALQANLASIVFDFVARQKIGGTNMSFFIFRQLPILPPSAYTEEDLAIIVPRVLELTYTAHDLRPWAEDVVASWNRAHPGEPLALPAAPYAFDPGRRAQLRAELDARYARLYGLTRDELRYILDPADTHGRDYPTETFRVLKNNDIKNHGHYRTQRLVIEAWDRMEVGGTSAAVSSEIESDPREAVVSVTLPSLGELKSGNWAWPPDVDRADRLRFAAQYALWLADPTQDASRLRILVACLAEPALLSAWLPKDERSQWERLIGREARLPAAGVVRLNPKTHAAWRSAFERLISSGQLQETQDGKWMRGPHFDASGLSTTSPHALRAAFALHAIRRMDQEQLQSLIVIEDNIVWEKLAYGA